MRLIDAMVRLVGLSVTGGHGWGPGLVLAGLVLLVAVVVGALRHRGR